jgi:hypothetical protein
VAGPVGEVLAGVVNDLVGAEGADQLHLGRAGHPGDLCAERLGQLHGERSYPTGRPDDHDLLAWLQLPRVAEGLQGGEAGDGTAAACSKLRLAGLGASLSG